jgi:riboflavin kinase / FMN adenylyltransferase
MNIKKNSGKKCSGEGRGKIIGFPTINVLLSSLSEEEYGVYAVKVFLEGNLQEYLGVGHFGPRPTFGDIHFSAEIHLFSFSDDIKDGVEITIFRILPKIRSIQKFSSSDELKKQINLDIDSARKILAVYNK